MHIFQNVGHKFLMVLIRRNCFKIVIFYLLIFFFGGGKGLGRVPPPPTAKKEVPLTVKIWLFSVKRSKSGGSAPDNQDSFELIIFLLLTCVIFYGKIWCWPQRGIEGKILQPSYIHINVNHSSNCWILIHHFERTLIKLQYWTVIALIIIL